MKIRWLDIAKRPFRLRVKVSWEYLLVIGLLIFLFRRIRNSEREVDWQCNSQILAEIHSACVSGLARDICSLLAFPAFSFVRFETIEGIIRL